MFFDPERIGAVREMILAHDTAGRERALAKILPMQAWRLPRDIPRHERPAL